MRHVYHDGGRKDAGFKGDTGDCVVRSIAIATGLPYDEVYKFVADHNATTRKTRRSRPSIAGRKSARHGTYTKRKRFKEYMRSLGFEWTSTMTIGSGCQVHLATGELPKGRLIARVSRHWCAVIDGVVYDTYDPSRGGTRCVYGYWRLRADA